MSVRSIRWWHWMLVAVAAGAAVGYARVTAEGDLSAYLGRGINGQRAFEEALVSVEQGRPRFADVSVHVRRVPDRRGGSKRVYVVAGSYFDGHYEQRAGKVTAEWRPAFFLADADAPYRPTAAAWERLGRPDARQRFESLANPTVADYLDCLAAAGRPPYTRAWWLGRGVAEWTAAGFVVIGLVWPACVNLLLYGSLRAPPREKGIDLSKVKPRPAPTPAEAAVTGIDLDRLHELEAAMEKELAEEAPVSVPAAAAPPPPAVRKLKAEPVVTSPAAAAPEGPGYGMTPQDYYPSALHPPKPKPGQG